jgi:hypothetical protein
MRLLSSVQAKLLACPTGFTARGRVRVQGPASTWYDLTNFLGRDFLEEVTVDESLDAPVGQATVRLLREVHGLSLAPFVTDSPANNLGGAYSPLLQLGRTFRVEVGLAPSGMEPGASDWLPLFLGRIDEVDSGPAVLTFTGRDYLGGALQDVYIEQEHTYGSTAGVPLQTVCQAILTDAGLGSVGLYTPTDPAWSLGPYKQDVEPVMDALSKLATARGWEVRQKLRPDTSDWGLWLWGPDRAATAASWVYTASDYQEVGQLSTALGDIRTAVEVVFSDHSDLDAALQPKRKTVRRENATATASYGLTPPGGGPPVPRFMRLAEGATSNIRTLAEAERLADAALADLSDGTATVLVEVAHHPALDLADLVQLAANGVNFTAAQTLAVRQLTHTLSSSSARTRLALKGKPALSPRTWLDMEARPGIAPAAPFTGPAAPSGLAVTNTVSGAALLFTAPSTGPEADSYELHVGTSAGFALSSATLKAVSSSTRFDVSGLVAGGAYWARVRSRDKKGNVGPASDEVSLAPRYVSPSLLLPNVTEAVIPRNSDFEAHTNTLAPPDAWSLSDDAIWGVDSDTETSTGFVFSGKRSVRLFGTGVPFIQSQAFTVRPGDKLVASALVLIPAPQNTSHTARLIVFWLNANLEYITETIASATYSAPTNDWQTLGIRARPVTVPAAARYARLAVQKDTAGINYSVYVDSTRVVTLPSTFLWRYPTLEATNGWTYVSGRAPPRYRVSALGEIMMSGSVTGGGTNSVILYIDSGDRPGFDADFSVVGNGNNPAAIRISASTGAVTLTSGFGPLSFDGVKFYAEPAGTL